LAVAWSMGCSETEESDSSSTDVGSVGDIQEDGLNVGDLVQGDCTSDDREYCATCECDQQCGEGGRCLEDSNGESFCSIPCSVSKNDCAPGHYCKQFGQTSQDFGCFPDYGSCTGDGSACSPCISTDECQGGHLCHTSKLNQAMSCYEECEEDEDCSEGTSCKEKDGLCYPEVGSSIQDVCSVGGRGLCEPCSFSFDCEGGFICSYDEDDGAEVGYCTMTCQKLGGVDSTCPYGMFCIGGVCSPPPAYKCQGWLSCAFVCDSNEVCNHGFCHVPCTEDTECPFGQTCDGEYCVAS
jgi:hypothetical protein